MSLCGCFGCFLLEFTEIHGFVDTCLIFKFRKFSAIVSSNIVSAPFPSFSHNVYTGLHDGGP